MKTLQLLIIFMLPSFAIAQQNNSVVSINKFSFNLYKQLYKSNENLVFSPYSMFGALSLTQAGAEKDTRDEMAKTLEIENDNEIPESFYKLNETLSASKNIKILTANSIWLSEQLSLKKSFSKISKQYYEATANKGDFFNKKNREKIRKEINKWVEQKTNKMIKDFIEKKMLQPTTALVLVNAIYFNAQWQKEFNKDNIYKNDFILASGNKTECKMMKNNQKINYLEDENYQIVELPYKDNSASMIIFLPKQDKNLSSIEFSYDYYSDILRSFEAKQVDINIPKFNMSKKNDMRKILENLGMKKAFSKDADFSRMIKSNGISISKVIHQAAIEVNEKGTEASAATAVIAVRSAMVIKDQPIIFKADRPFNFIIKENKSGAILFMGHVAEPIN